MPVDKEPYTPSFESVKAFYVQGVMDGSDPVQLSGLTKEEAEARFMRWFHAHNQKVLKLERKKIWLALEQTYRAVTGHG